MFTTAIYLLSYYLSFQGIDLSANQDEVGDKETFQVEWDNKTLLWRFRTSENKYWSLEQASGIQGVGDVR